MKATVIKPPPLSLFLEDDYIMKNHLEIFESHMFLTTEHAVQTQSFIPKIPFAVGLAENKSINTDYDSQETRLQALQQFNTCLFNHKGRRPHNGDVGCFLGTFQVDTDDEEDAEMYILAYRRFQPRMYVDFAKKLSGFIVEFSSRSHRITAVTPHFFQNYRYPHFHFLYEKIEDTDDENLLQRYLYDKLNNICRFKF